MAEPVLITWSIENWITVILMALIGFALLGLGMKLYQKKAGGAQ